MIDGLKGLAVALAAQQLIGDSFWIQAVALLGAVLGHNYPVWLKFHGGRGLATAAGGFFAIGVSFTIVWCLTWFLAYKGIHDILKSNLVAIIVTPLILVALPPQAIQALMIRNAAVDEYLIFGVLLSVVLLFSHSDAIKESLVRKKEAKP